MVELGVELQQLGHRVTVAVHDYEPGSEFDGEARRLDIRAVRCGTAGMPRARRDLMQRLWRGMPEVAKLVPEDVDAINAHEWPALRAGRLASGRTGAPLVWTRNDDTTWERGFIPREGLFDAPSLPGRLLRMATGLPDLLDARRAAATVVLDTHNQAAVRRAYRRQAEILRCGPPPVFFDRPERDEARKRVGIKPGEFLVFAVGILFPHRRFEDLIDAAALVGSDEGLRVRIVGSPHADPSYARMLAERVERSQANDRIELVQHSIPEAELRDQYAAADVCVWPNRRQAYGLAPLEALASGTPVIISTGIGVKEAIAGRAGVTMVPPEDPAELARAIRAAMASNQRGQAEETREWLREELSNRRYAERMLEIFERASNGMSKHQVP